MTPPWQAQSPTPTETTDFRDYVRPIWAHKFLILILVTVVTAGTYWHYNKQPRVYSTSTQVYVGSSDSAGSAADDRALANQARLLQTPEVAARVAKQLKFPGDPRELLGTVAVSPLTGTDSLQITATAGDPNLTAR